jgi:hypothetical protein
MKKLALVLLLTAASSALAQQPGVTATLAIGTPRILPGVPFDVVVQVRNSSKNVVGIGSVVAMTVRRSGGAAVHLPAVMVEPTSDGLDEIASGETVTATVSWTEQLFFQDVDVSGPGEYDISVELRGETPAAADGGVVEVKSITTPAVHLTRMQPEGEDAVVWQRMLAVGRGAWPSAGLGHSFAGSADVADEVFTRHPASQYFPYALLLQGVELRRMTSEALEAAANRFKTSPPYARLLLAAAAAAEREARQSTRDGNLAAAETSFRRAVSLVEQALATGNLAVQQRGRWMQANVQETAARVVGKKPG